MRKVKQMEIVRASKKKAKARIALFGPSGSGKTYTALSLAQHMGERVFVLDTEHLSASKYADIFTFDTHDEPLVDFSPQTYVAAIEEIGKLGYDVLIIDSLSHAWMGKGGALEQVDNAAAKGGNSYTAWRNVTPWHNKMIDAILAAPMHVIATMRSKTEYVMEENAKGKQAPRKVGLAPIQRDGMEYEFDVTGDMDLNNTLHVSKSRCPAIAGKSYKLPGKELADILTKWLSTGETAKVITPKPAKRPVEDGKTDAGKPFDAAKIVDAFAAICITREEVEVAYGKPMAEWSEADKHPLGLLYVQMKKEYEANQPVGA